MVYKQEIELLSIKKERIQIIMGKDGKCSVEPVDNSCCKSSVNPLTECFFSIPPKQFTLLASLLGILLIDNLDAGQQNSLGNFLVSVGQTILTAAAQESLLQSGASQNDQIRQQIQIIKKQLCMLEQEIEKA